MNEPQKITTDFEGKKCIIRCYRSGVFFAELGWLAGQTAKLLRCRNIFSWAGAASCLQLALDGTKLPQECRLTVEVSSLIVTDVAEIIPCTDKAITILNSIEPWKA